MPEHFAYAAAGLTPGAAEPPSRIVHDPDPITWKEADVMTLKDAKTRREAPLDTPTDLTSNATRDISGALSQSCSPICLRSM